MTTPKAFRIRKFPRTIPTKEGGSAEITGTYGHADGEMLYEGTLHRPGNKTETDCIWKLSGKRFGYDDLVLPTRRKPKAGGAGACWGVWVPCVSRKEARIVRADIRRSWCPPIIAGKVGHPQVRRAASRKGRK